jgi:O-antigen biosynthesis protein WbqV
MGPSGLTDAADGLGPIKTDAVLIGTTATVRTTIQSLRSTPERTIRVRGVFTPDAGGADALEGVPILGATLTRAGLEATGEGVHAAIFCTVVEDRTQARRLLTQAAELRLRPLVAELDGGVMSLRAMEMADILGRAPSPVDWENIRAAISGKRVMVTGAGGSIGSETVRQLAGLPLARLTLLDSSEFNLFTIDHEMAKLAPDLPRATALCDIRNPDALGRWFARERPEIVFHIAALKQVPMLETHASEGVLTNIMGTRNVARAARAAGAHMVLVSTDKAVSPRSTMGATKRVAELFCQALDVQSGRRNGPRFLVARLGNVLGSAGSVSPLFERQLAAGGPLTVTHPDVVRYFITIPQAASFLLQATASHLTTPDAPRGVAQVLEMGEPVRVLDLARDIVRLAGKRPDIDVKIQFVGLRPGEKMAEQLIGEQEWIVGKSDGPVISVMSEPREMTELEAEMDALIHLAQAGRDEMVKTRVMALAGQTPEAEEERAVG